MSTEQAKSTAEDEVSRRTAFMTKKQLIDVLQHMVSSMGEEGMKTFLQAEQAVLSQLPQPPSLKTGAEETANKKQRVDSKQNFDMSRYRQRHIAMQVQYDGSKYYGFASQDSEDTIENHLFAALLKLNLIEDRKTCQYSRCGRTDKGVSALGQVVALKIRSSIPLDVPEDQIPLHPCDAITVKVAEKKQQKKKKDNNHNNHNNQSEDNNEVTSVEKEVKEMDYCTMMNHCLPEDIRVVGWCPVTEEFSARFSASYRTYRYFFIKKDLNLQKMEQACHYLIGNHDFRNICKLDVANVTNFEREIYYANISCFQPCEFDDSKSIWMLEIRGIAFLWHMVRCIMALLFMVGEGKEEPEIVKELLDIEKNPAKPSYGMADDFPLVLHECGFDRLTLHAPPKNLWNLTSHYSSLWERYTIAAARAKNSLEYVQSYKVRRADVDVFSLDIKQHAEKTNKRLQDKGYQTTSTKEIADIAVSSSNNKRKFDEMDDKAVTSDTDLISWQEALNIIQNNTLLTPKANTGPHVPLLLRNKEHSYEDRIKSLVGQKKERFERHITLSSSASESTPKFFEKMRQQGSL